MTEKKTDDWLIKNAIGCWLHHFPDHPWTERYQELVKREVYLTPPKPKPRPARRRSQSQSKDAADAITGDNKVE
jgi:hypothetical protein